MNKTILGCYRIIEATHRMCQKTVDASPELSAVFKDKDLNMTSLSKAFDAVGEDLDGEGAFLRSVILTLETAHNSFFDDFEQFDA